MPERIGDTSVLTTIHFAVIAILVALTIAGILWGMRLKRARRVAEDASEARVEAGEAEQARTPDAPPTGAGAAPTPMQHSPALPSEPEPAPPLAAEPLAGEPVAAAAPSGASQQVEAIAPFSAAEPAAPADPGAVDAPVTALKGVGPKVAAMLEQHGIVTVGQLAALDAGEAEAIDARLGPFTGRMGRDRWIEQARFLAAGDRAGFEAVFGKL